MTKHEATNAELLARIEALERQLASMGALPVPASDVGVDPDLLAHAKSRFLTQMRELSGCVPWKDWHELTDETRRGWIESSKEKRRLAEVAKERAA